MSWGVALCQGLAFLKTAPFLIPAQAQVTYCGPLKPQQPSGIQGTSTMSRSYYRVAIALTLQHYYEYQSCSLYVRGIISKTLLASMSRIYLFLAHFPTNSSQPYFF